MDAGGHRRPCVSRWEERVAEHPWGGVRGCETDFAGREKELPCGRTGRGTEAIETRENLRVWDLAPQQ